MKKFAKYDIGATVSTPHGSGRENSVGYGVVVAGKKVYVGENEVKP